MNHDAAPEFDGPLTIVLQVLLRALRDQRAEAVAGRRAAGEWERRAVLGIATLANELGLRAREAEYRERRVRRQLEDLVSVERPADEIRRDLVRIVAEARPH